MGFLSRPFERLAKTLLLRFLLVGGVLHVGLFLGVYAVLELKLSGVAPEVWGKVLGAIGLLYGAWGLVAFFALRPAYRAWRIYRRIMDWRRFIVEDLPRVARELRDAWAELRRESGAEKGPAHGEGAQVVDLELDPAPAAKSKSRRRAA